MKATIRRASALHYFANHRARGYLADGTTCAGSLEQTNCGLGFGAAESYPPKRLK
jgi:hypothetical protein